MRQQREVTFIVRPVSFREIFAPATRISIREFAAPPVYFTTPARFLLYRVPRLRAGRREWKPYIMNGLLWHQYTCRRSREPPTFTTSKITRIPSEIISGNKQVYASVLHRGISFLIPQQTFSHWNLLQVHRSILAVAVMEH